MEISFEKIVRIVKKNALIIIASALVFFGIALAVMTFLIAPTYTVSARFYVSDPSRQQGGSSSYTDYNYETRVVNTYAEMLKSNDFFDIVYRNLPAETKDRITAAQIKSGTSFSVVTNTEIISATFQNSDKSLVYPVMQTILLSVQEHVSKAYKREDIETGYVETPTKDSVKISSNRTKIVSVIAAVLGALAAIAFFYIRDALDVHIRGANDITEKYKLPVLGRIPSFDTAALRKKEAAGDGKAKE
jgi:capsular polysaccharide biosynthesis protein